MCNSDTISCGLIFKFPLGLDDFLNLDIKSVYLAMFPFQVLLFTAVACLNNVDLLGSVLQRLFFSLLWMSINGGGGAKQL